MASDGVNCNLFIVLSHQAEVQLNVKVSPDDWRDAIKKNIDDFLPNAMTPEKFSLSLPDKLTIDSTD